MESNPFEILKITPRINLDLAELRAAYIQIQREAHPDLGFDGVQAELANKAYSLLKGFETRLECLLKFYGDWPPNPNQIDFDFLDFAMELGAEIDEVSPEDMNEKTRLGDILKQQRAAIEQHIQENINVLDSNIENRLSPHAISIISDVYQKSKYLTRLEKNLRGESEM